MRIAETGGNERRDWKASQKKKKEARWAAALQSLQILHGCYLGEHGLRMGNSCNSIFRAGVSDAKAQKLLRFVWEVGKRRESIE
jgi:hypothetical protein